MIAQGFGFTSEYSPKVGALGDIDIAVCKECGGTVKVIPKAFAALTGQALASIEETAGPRRRDQADTCTPAEKSGIKRIQSITREQGTAPPTVGAMRRIGLFG